MKKFSCFLSALLLLSLCGCKPFSEYLSGSVNSADSFYTTSIVGTFDDGDSSSSANSSSQNKVSSTVTGSKPPKTSSHASSVQASSTVPSQKPVSSDKVPQNSATSSLGQPYTPSGNVTYYYYNKLSEGQKKLYGIINDAVKNMTSGMISLGKCSGEDVSLVFNAVRTDHPEYFWIPAAYANEIRGAERFIAFDYHSENIDISYTCSREERDRMQTALNARVKEIRADVFKNGMNIYELELALHDRICADVIYNSTDAFVSTAYGALVNGKALCEGYSRAMQLLCNEFAIPCTLVCGTATDPSVNDATPQPHMWNIIWLDGKGESECYHVDVTWDDSRITLKSSSGTQEYEVTLHSYFNITDRRISATHTMDPDFSHMSSADILDGKSYNFSLPKCTATKDSFAARGGCTLDENIETSKTVINNVLRNAASTKKSYCEFELSYDPGAVSSEGIVKKYSLQNQINMLNLSIDQHAVNAALSGQTFIVFLKYEGE